MFLKLFAYLTITSMPLMFTYLLNRRYKKLQSALKTDNKYYYHCILFKVNDNKCRKHIYKRNSCGEDCSYHKIKTLLNFIGSAKKTISICLYTFSLKDVQHELLKAYQRGVKIRAITDYTMYKIKVSKFRQLANIGMEVRTPQKYDRESLMHHKFGLIDEYDEEDSKMWMGSLNLTLQGIASNFEFTVLTNDKEMIESYRKEYENLWNDFE